METGTEEPISKSTLFHKTDDELTVNPTNRAVAQRNSEDKDDNSDDDVFAETEMILNRISQESLRNVSPVDDNKSSTKLRGKSESSNKSELAVRSVFDDEDGESVSAVSSELIEDGCTDPETGDSVGQSGGGRIVRTVAILLAYLAVGMSSASYGPVMVTMEIILDTDTKTISSVFTSHSLGFLVGSVTCGVVYGRMNRDLMFGIMMLGVAISTVLVPYSGYWYVLVVISAFNGFFGAFPDVGGNTYVLNMWADHKAKEPLLQALHAVWSIGATVSPFIIAIFLVDVSGYMHLEFPENGTRCSNLSMVNLSLLDSRDGVFHLDDKLEELSENVAEFENSTMDMLDLLEDIMVSNETWRPVWNGDRLDEYRDCMENVSLRDHLILPELVTRIQIPFLILGVIVLGTSIFFFCLFFMDKRNTPGKRASDKSRDDSTVAEEKWFRIQILVIMFLFYVFYVCLEAVPGRFIAMFVVKGLGWRNKYGALITSLYWGSSGLGRIIGIFLSTVLKPRSMLIIDFGICTIGVMLLWFSPLNSAIPWLGAGVLGYGLATVFASGVLWVDEYIEVTGTASAVFVTASSCGSMIAPLITGVLFQDYGYMWFVYILVCTDCVVILTYMTAWIRAQRHGKRDVVKLEQLNNKDDILQEETLLQ